MEMEMGMGMGIEIRIGRADGGLKQAGGLPDINRWLAPPERDSRSPSPSPAADGRPGASNPRNYSRDLDG